MARAPCENINMLLRDLQIKFGGECLGEVARPLTGVGTIERAMESEITFLANSRYRAALAATKAGAVILSEKERDATAKPRLIVSNPYAYFAKVAQLFSPPISFASGVHASAVVSATAHVAASASIAEFVSIGDHVVIGENVRIGVGSVIGNNVSIANNTQLVARVTVYGHCQIGARNLIHAGVVIGADGFGFAPDFDGGEGQWQKIPQTGRVIIGDDVEIGANTTIDRGAMDDTVIGNDVKLDNQIQVGHNCVIGDHTVISGCVGIAGSTKIGKRVMIGGKAGIIGHLTIGDDVIVSAMTLVTKSILKAGTYTSGTPLMPHREWLKNAAHLRRLDLMADKIKLSANKIEEGE
jgi:UDP-3-O-[3-hydroxymyristoyl] glucosamine N-acyltransferase